MTEGNANGIGTAELRRLSRENTLAGAAARNILIIEQRHRFFWFSFLISFVMIVVAFLCGGLMVFPISLAGNTTPVGEIFTEAVRSDPTSSFLIILAITLLFTFIAVLVRISIGKSIHVAKTRFDTTDFLNVIFYTIRYESMDDSEKALIDNDSNNSSCPLKKIKELLTLKNIGITDQELLWRAAWRGACRAIKGYKQARIMTDRQSKQEHYLCTSIIAVLVTALAVTAFLTTEVIWRCTAIVLVVFMVFLLFVANIGSAKKQKLYAHREEDQAIHRGALYFVSYFTIFGIMLLLFKVYFMWVFMWVLIMVLEFDRVLSRYLVMREFFNEIISLETAHGKPEAE